LLPVEAGPNLGTSNGPLSNILASSKDKNKGKRRKDMKNFKQLMNNLMVEESGQDLIEYALVAALVGLGAVASMKSLSTSIGNAFSSIGTTLTSNV
jgi:pilus assembly protein Flp/PilA